MTLLPLLGQDRVANEGTHRNRGIYPECRKSILLDRNRTPIASGRSLGLRTDYHAPVPQPHVPEFGPRTHLQALCTLWQGRLLR